MNNVACAQFAFQMLTKAIPPEPVWKTWGRKCLAPVAQAVEYSTWIRILWPVRVTHWVKQFLNTKKVASFSVTNIYPSSVENKNAVDRILNAAFINNNIILLESYFWKLRAPMSPWVGITRGAKLVTYDKSVQNFRRLGTRRIDLLAPDRQVNCREYSVMGY